MIFAVQGGSVDVLVGDYAQVSPACLPVAPEGYGLASEGYYKVVAVSSGNPLQIEIAYVGQSGQVTNMWVDAMWFTAFLRPQTIA